MLTFHHTLTSLPPSLLKDIIKTSPKVSKEVSKLSSMFYVYYRLTLSEEESLNAIKKGEKEVIQHLKKVFINRELPKEFNYDQALDSYSEDDRASQEYDGKKSSELPGGEQTEQLTIEDSKRVKKARDRIQNTLNRLFEDAELESYSKCLATQDSLPVQLELPVLPKVNEYLESLTKELEKAICLIMIPEDRVSALQSKYREQRMAYLNLIEHNIDVEAKTIICGLTGVVNTMLDSESNSDQPSSEDDSCNNPSQGQDFDNSGSSKPVDEDVVNSDAEEEDNESEEEQKRSEEEDSDDMSLLIDKNDKENNGNVLEINAEDKVVVKPLADYDSRTSTKDFIGSILPVQISSDIARTNSDYFDSFVRNFASTCKNINSLRSGLHTASSQFIEAVVGALSFPNTRPPNSIKLSDASSASFGFAHLFHALSLNPLNELRLLDTILTMYSFSSYNSEALDIWNEHFSSKFTSIEMQEAREKILEFITGLLRDSYSISEVNGATIPQYDERVAQVEKLLGVSPLKQKLMTCCSVLKLSPSNFHGELIERLRISRIPANKSWKLAETFVTVLRPHKALKPEMDDAIKVQSVEAIIVLLPRLQPKSRLEKELKSIAEEFFKNDEGFFNYWAMTLPFASESLEQLNQKVIRYKEYLKCESPDWKGTKNESSNSYPSLQAAIEDINQDVELKKFDFLLGLLVEKWSSFAKTLRQGNNNNEKAIDTARRLQNMIEVMLEHKAPTDLYYYLAQSLELGNKIFESGGWLRKNPKSIEPSFDLLLNIWRVSKIEEALKANLVIVTSPKKESEEPKPKPSFRRIATKEGGFAEEKKEGPGFKKSISQLRRSDMKINFNELLARLSQTAGVILQTIKTHSDLNKTYELCDLDEIPLKRIKLDLYREIPWLLTFKAKCNLLLAQALAVPISLVLGSIVEEDGLIFSLPFLIYHRVDQVTVIRRDLMIRDTKTIFSGFSFVSGSKLHPRLTFEFKFKGEAGIDQGNIALVVIHLTVVKVA